MSKALYRKYRSRSLDQVIGQSHVTDILTRAIKTGRLSHAYLLTGPRGVGKTSIARILAHEINHTPYDEDGINLDIIEIDAASNNGVEDVRDLREKVQIAPVSGEKKVYIIDEVHMLSKPAFNALLKTLEEPPEHVVFILATTDVDKLPATVISRTQRFSFRAISKKDMVDHLKYIAKEEKIKTSDDALELIAERSDGSFRDSISLLDQLSSLVDKETGITADLIEKSLGLAEKKTVDKILEAVENHDIEQIVKMLDVAYDNGINGIILSQQLTTRIRELVLEKPNLLQLMDLLLDVPRSAQPNLKLLSVIGSFATPKESNRSAALSAPVLEVSATIKELEKEAVKEKPGAKKSNSIAKISKVSKKTASEPISSSIKIKNSSTDFNWAALIDYTRKNYVAIYSVLANCGYELEGDDLTIYTVNKFYKKKLDDVKYGHLIQNSLKELGLYELTVHTIPTAAPPKDSQATTAFAIMGGGEEVVIEDGKQ